MRIPIENVEVQQLSFLWYPFVPFGVPTVFQGQAGYGKTTIISKIAAELSHGIYPPRLRHGAVKGRGFLTEWQMEAIDYMLNNVPERDHAELTQLMKTSLLLDERTLFVYNDISLRERGVLLWFFIMAAIWLLSSWI